MINTQVIIFISMVVISTHAASTCNVGLPKKTNSKKLCLEVGKPCLASKYPCCPFNYRGGVTGPKPLLCFKFGKGICQEIGSIKNLTEYNRLLRQLNGTNFQALKKKYWAAVSGHKVPKFIPEVKQI